MASKKRSTTGASTARRAREAAAGGGRAARGLRSRGVAKSSGKAKAARPAPKARKPRAPTSAAKKKTAARPKTAARKPAASRSAASRAKGRTASTGAAGKRRAAAPGARSAPAGARRRRGEEKRAPSPAAIASLPEEDQIRAAKFVPRELPRRAFEEDRFVFPESYGIDRVRLLVRDPDWIFAYWDVRADSMKDLARVFGERAFALSRLTLRVMDPVSGGASDILLPPGARWWYVRTDATRRAYRAQIGVTLPSGEFRQLAESNTVVTPRVGPSREPASRRLSYREAAAVGAEEAAAAGRAARKAGLAGGPWKAGQVDGESSRRRGGASDVFRPGAGGEAARGGASDVHRPGASGTHRR
jgi:hypothetical protein